jgi:hypothetical protein
VLRSDIKQATTTKSTFAAGVTPQILPTKVLIRSIDTHSSHFLNFFCAAPSFKMRLLLSLLLLSPHTSFAALVASSAASSSTQKDDQPQRRRRQLREDSRIIGGSEVVPIARYPFFAFVLADLGSRGTVPCGGTLIHSDIILTAASCVQSETIQVVVNLSDFDNTGGSIPRTVTATKVHPDFVGASLENDLALLLLDIPITDVALGNLNADSSVPSEADDVTVIGFGSLSEEEFDPSRVLQGVVLQVSDFETCNQAYQGKLNVDEQLCAGVEEGGKVCLLACCVCTFLLFVETICRPKMWHESTESFYEYIRDITDVQFSHICSTSYETLAYLGCLFWRRRRASLCNWIG